MKGKVYLIGAGPGDPGLITLKGSSYLKEADVVVYDRLASPRLLEDLKEGCRLIYVGKASKDHTKTQDEINEIIFQESNKGNIVARLKGGDPYVFGRGGEEAEYLYDRGIDFEVVPGVTSAIGGLAYAGIPITHRGIATSFHVITGHLKDENEELDWKALAALKGTLVFLMGVSNLQKITENLLKHGKSKETPAAIINWGTTPRQQVLEGNLSNIYEKALKEKIKPPSLIAIGDVVSLREKLNFYEKKPLLGENIVVTREKAHAIDTIKKIEKLGGNVISFPTIKLEEITPNKELEEAIKNISKYSYIVFTSVTGVDIFFKKLLELEDIRTLAGIKIAAVGIKTANAIRKYGIIVDIIPEEFVAEDLIDKLKEVLTREDKVLIPRAKLGRQELVEELGKVSLVDELVIYDTVKSKESKDEIMNAIEDLDSYYLLFTSSSTFANFVEILGNDSKIILDKGKIISIGPITTKTIEDEGYVVYRQAETYTVDGVLELLMKEKR
ncbi:uroporphyrinogen-III C-methyltransferase [Tissierella carlieri]|uniref:uroporphyrinogen-III C-methyltransferase n=1 Tax=Tissierella carlieri TaxID=689904 RepID=A0ABT1SAC9_9FIRM|nr:uroporphyrinogen-III C-methyltransferase [Tissierella carlieri]MBU5314337.1 uroporphyrinogen-III C-methyltransferase [Tissierella carlieri]MCQ4923265.1 uroporphyrinogen-III C-methyltransferase [Tissierella carlieri]